MGTRRECAGLIHGGWVRIDGRVCSDPDAEFPTADLEFEVRSQRWPYRSPALVVMHKPAGYECSQKPKHHPSVYTLLPEPLRRRNVQAIGRLDEDTTGLLLFTDDGQLIHRWTSPKHELPKVYEVRCKHAVTSQQIAQLLSGVQLVDDPESVRADACTATGVDGLRLTLTQGKYHQVKRMVAAVGNRVEALHRSAFGVLELPADLLPGQWRWLSGPGDVSGA